MRPECLDRPPRREGRSRRSRAARRSMRAARGPMWSCSLSAKPGWSHGGRQIAVPQVSHYGPCRPARTAEARQPGARWCPTRRPRRCLRPQPIPRPRRLRWRASARAGRASALADEARVALASVASGPRTSRDVDQAEEGGQSKACRLPASTSRRRAWSVVVGRARPLTETTGSAISIAPSARRPGVPWGGSAAVPSMDISRFLPVSFFPRSIPCTLRAPATPLATGSRSKGRGQFGEAGRHVGGDRRFVRPWREC